MKPCIRVSALSTDLPINLSQNWFSKNESTPVTAAISEQCLSWLCDPHSLTARLKARCDDFKVKVLFEDYVEHRPEFNVPKSICDKRYLLRQVLLMCSGQAQVFASTLIPVTTLNTGNEFLLSLGDQPLGEALFKHKDISREAIEIALFDKSSHVMALAQELPLGLNQSQFEQTKIIFGRRSIFKLIDQGLLVSEVFLPNSYAYETQ